MIQRTNPALSAALAAVTDDQADEPTQLILTKCRALIRGYDRRFASAPYRALAVEQLMTAPLVNPETQRTSHTFRLAGRIDVLAAFGDRLVLFDHKTTSQDIADPDAPYWRQLVIEGQVSHYMLLLWLNGQKADEAVWDVMRKPSIAPKRITKAEQRSAVGSQQYFDWRLSQASLDALQISERETLEMYEARLTHDCSVERPNYYFQRRTVPRLDSEILDYARELWEHGQELLHVRKENRHARNSGACLLYNSPCKFLGICSGYDKTDSEKWVRKTQVHNELPELEGDGRNILTNSRIRCFQTCRRKHYHEYELGIERFDAEEKESLVFGTLWHRALQAWWSVSLTKEPENGNRSAEPASSELAASSGIASQAPIVG